MNAENGQPAGSQVPRMPWGIYLDGAAVDIDRLADGFVEVVLTPIAVGGGRVGLMPPQIRLRFNADGYENFSRIVAAGGKRSPLVLADRLPPEPPAAS